MKVMNFIVEKPNTFIIINYILLYSVESFTKSGIFKLLSSKHN